LGAGAHFIGTDISDDDAIDACIAEVLGRFGRIDFLVNNACLYDDAGLDSTREQWRRVLDVNLIGAAVFAAKAAVHMTNAGSAIVNIGSIGGKFGAVDRMVYPASKAALLQITKNLAATLAPRGIRVLSVSPGTTWSPAVEGLAGSVEAADAAGAVLHPLGRIGRGRDVGDVVLFACSELAGFMTGTDLAVDGGYTMLGPDQGRGPRFWIAAGRRLRNL
jgi:NAD(P)-dependent dehydrogenase (short-subunit alcohol dehydrogenase family)